ncbi:MAG: ribosomal protein L7/L12 [Pseudomonadota bacterium]
MLLGLAIVLFIGLGIGFVMGSARKRAPLPREEVRARFDALPPEKREGVERLAADGKKIEAIKELREATGLGLAEAKDVVDQAAAERPIS